jgi:hypothetical protein
MKGRQNFASVTTSYMFSVKAKERLGPTFLEHSGHAPPLPFTPLVHKLQLFCDYGGDSSSLHIPQIH